MLRPYSVPTVTGGVCMTQTSRRLSENSTSGSLNPRRHVERMPDSSLPWTSPGLCNAMAAPQRHDALQRAIASP